MQFGEKLKKLREEKGMTQQEFADAVGISLRTVGNYEKEGRLPRYRSVYEKIAGLFGVSVTYLLSDADDFILTAGEQYGARGAEQARDLVQSMVGLMAGGNLPDEDKKAILDALQEAYYFSKKENQKYASAEKKGR